MQTETAKTLADAGREAALATADAACSDWSDKALAYVKAFPFEDFMAEEIRAWAYSSGLPKPPDSRAWGGVMKRAAHLGIVTRLRYDETRSKQAHGTLGTVWTKNKAKAMQRPAPAVTNQASIIEALAIVNALAAWSVRYPRSGIYHADRQQEIDGALIAIELRAKAFVNDPLQAAANALATSAGAGQAEPAAQAVARAAAAYVAQRMSSGLIAGMYGSYLLRELFDPQDLVAANDRYPQLRLLEKQQHDGDAQA